MSDSRFNLGGDDALRSLHASPINQTIAEMLASDTPINPKTQVTVQDIKDLAKRCGIPTIPDAGLTKEDIASKIHFWLRDNNERPTTIRMIMNSAPSISGGSHYFVAEFNVNNAGKVDAVNIVDSLDKDSTDNQAYRDSLQSEILAALQFTDESITSALGVDRPTYKLTSPLIQPDAWSCGYYVLMNLINSLDKDKPKPGHDDTSLRAKLRTAHDTASEAINTESAVDAKLQLANALRDMCFEDLGVDPRTGHAIAVSPTSSSAAAATPITPSTSSAPTPDAATLTPVAATSSTTPASTPVAMAKPTAAATTVAKPAFQNMMIKYKVQNKSAKDQAQEILNVISKQLNDHAKFGLTYSANSQQTAAIHEYNKNPTPANYETMKTTFATAENQGKVVKELLSLIDATEDEAIKAALKDKIRILPITTILRDTADHPTTDKQLDEDIGHIFDFAERNGCILGWQNEDSAASGDDKYAIGGGIAKNTFSVAQNNHVQGELKRIHDAIAANQGIPPQQLLAQPTATAHSQPPAPAASPTATHPSSKPAVTGTPAASSAPPNTDAAPTTAEKIAAKFEAVVNTDNETLGKKVISTKKAGANDDTLRLLAQTHVSNNDIEAGLETEFFNILDGKNGIDGVTEKSQEAYSRALIASINRYAELKFSSHADLTTVGELEKRISELRQILLENQEILSELKTNHLDKISTGKREKCKAEIEKRMTLPSVKTALEYAERFDKAKDTVEGWLEASILERSKAVECTSNEDAMNTVGNILGSTVSTPNSMPGLADGDDKVIGVSGKPTISVFDMSITMKNHGIIAAITHAEPDSIKAATVRTVDEATQTVKSEFYFQPGELEKFKSRKNTDADMMKMVAQNVLNQFMPMSSATKPVRLNPGDPPMPKSMIEAYIIYCEFKGINLEPPIGYRQFQEDVKKPGWFGRNSIHDAFAKAWKISNPEDVGIEEQKKLEAEVTPPSKRP